MNCVIMKMFRVRSVKIFVLVILPIINCVGEVGTPCIYSFDGSKGFCVIAPDCEIAQKLTRVEYRVDSCGYQGLTPVICCPGIDPPKKSEANTVAPVRMTISSQKSTTSERNVENKAATSNRKAIAALMCSEYSRPVQHEINVITLVVKPDPMRTTVPICKYNAVPLIVGGEVATKMEFPHMAAIAYETDGELKYNCGGTLISEFFVLTAAHCTVDMKGVRLGALNLKLDESPNDYYLIDGVFTNPNYSVNMYNDIALIRLARRVEFSERVRPACLWTKDQVSSQSAIATGWGLTEFGGPNSDILLKVDLNILDLQTCSRSYKAYGELPYGIIPSQICAGKKHADTCQGDSGGPLAVTQKGNPCIFYVIGITSFGKPCGGQNAVGVYTRVSSYISWIEEVVWS